MSAFQPEKDRKSVRMLPRFITPSGKAALDSSCTLMPQANTRCYVCLSLAYHLTQLSNLLRRPFSLILQACGITPRPHTGAAVRAA